MASHPDKSVKKPAKPRPARKKTPAAVPPAAPPAPAETAAKGLLRKGLQAINEVRDDVIARQSRVFSALLGIELPTASKDRRDGDWKLLEGSDPDADKMKKFEEVFDQRVARSLERLGMPSPQALAALCEQLEAINEHLKRVVPASSERPARGARKKS